MWPNELHTLNTSSLKWRSSRLRGGSKASIGEIFKAEAKLTMDKVEPALVELAAGACGPL